MAQSAEKTIPKLVIRKVIKAKRERVFDAWSKPELLAQWLVPPTDWTARSKVDLRIGGRYEQEMIVGGSSGSCNPDGYKIGDVLLHHGEYLEILPPEKLVFTWNSHVANDTKVTIELKDLGDSTELWLTHELLPTEQLRQGHEEGWNGAFIKLEKLLAQL